VKAVSTGSAVTARPFSPPRIRHLETGWSNAFLRTADRVLHRVLFDFLAGIGVWVAVLALRQARRSSRRYLAAILGRPPSLLEVWRHFMAFTAVHLVRLRVAGGRLHACRAESGCEAFAGLMASGRPALLGTFHIGSSDLMGFYLGRFRRHVHMVRFRLGDPGFLRQLVDRCSAWVTFIWVNEKGNLLFALKQAVESGGSIAMKCDRVGYSAKLETFEFLGARRSFVRSPGDVLREPAGRAGRIGGTRVPGLRARRCLTREKFGAGPGALPGGARRSRVAAARESVSVVQFRRPESGGGGARGGRARPERRGGERPH
jgi:hypothetical protein